MAKQPRTKFRLIDNSDESWRTFGRDDPYFGVLSVDRFRAKNLDPAALAEFFASGDQHVEIILHTIQKHVILHPAMNDALDFGCGVGRLVLPLAAHYHAVMGIDISDAYIAEAERNRDRKGLGNITFAENLAGLIAQGRKFDLVHSCIVFNHISWDRGQHIIADLLGLLRPDGVMAIQVLHRRHASTVRRGISWARRNFLPLHWLINLSRGRSALEPLMQGNEYPLDLLLPFLRQCGATDFHVRIDPGPEGDFAFIFCRKATESRPGA